MPSSLRVFMGGTPLLPATSASAGHAGVSVSALGVTSKVAVMPLSATATFASLDATTNAIGAPVVLSVSVDTITDTSARVLWSVDQPVTGRVEYGLTTAYGSQTNGEATFNFSSHIQTVPSSGSLTPGTLYHFRVTGQNATGQTYASGDFTFTTTGGGGGATLPNIVNPMVFQSLVSAPQPAYLGVHICTHQSGTTEIARITNVASRVGYASRCVWNADGTMMAIGTGSTQQILNGNTYAPIFTGNSSWIWASCWAHTDPNIAFAFNSDLSSNVLRKFSVNPSTGAGTQLNTISAAALGHSEVAFSQSQGEQDNSDQFFAYAWRNSSGGAWGIGVFDLVNWTSYAERQMGTGAASIASVIDHTFMSQNGNWMSVTFIPSGSGVTQGMWAYEPDLNTLTRRQLHTSQEHADWARTPGGEDRFVRWSGSGIISINPVNGNNINMGPTSTPGSTHVSGRCWNAPGRVFVAKEASPPGSTPGSNQVYSLVVDDAHPNDARVYGFQHRTQDVGESIWVVPDPTGARCTLGTPWEGNATSYLYVMGVDVGI